MISYDCPDTHTLEKRISVVIPAFNAEPWLADCLQSVVSQKVPLDIVVVDDASPDNGARIVRNFASMGYPVRLVQNQTNVGLGESRNVGLRAARGELVCFVDADDLLSPGALSRMASVLKLTNSDFVTAPAEEFEDGRIVRTYWTTLGAIFSRDKYSTNLAADPDAIWDHTAWTKLFRREFLVENDLDFSLVSTCEDILFSARAYALASRFDVLSTPSYLYRRRREGSLTTTLSEANALNDWLEESTRVLDALQQHGHFKAAAEVCRKLLSVEYPSRVAQLGHPDVPEDLRSGLAERIIKLAPPDALADASEEVRAHLGWRDTTPQAPQHVRAALESPLLSVIMPTRNVGPWIDDAIRSVVSQTFDDFELLIVDDHSEDETWDRICVWANRDRRIRAQKNPLSGGGSARNTGLSYARGAFLAFCDGDDVVPSQAYQTLMTSILNDDVDIVVGGFLSFGANDILDPSPWFGYDRRQQRVTLTQSPKLIRHRACWNRIYRRSFWESSGIIFPDTARSNDIAPITAALAHATSINVVPACVYLYRNRPGDSSMTAQASSEAGTVSYFEQEIQSARQLADLHPASPLSLEYWDMVLSADGWGHLAAFLSTHRVSDGPNRLSAAIAELLGLLPERSARAANARRLLVFRLTAAGLLAHAKTLLQLELNPATSDSGSGCDIANVLKAAAQLECVPISEVRHAVHQGMLSECEFAECWSWIKLSRVPSDHGWDASQDTLSIEVQGLNGSTLLMPSPPGWHVHRFKLCSSDGAVSWCIPTVATSTLGVQLRLDLASIPPGLYKIWSVGSDGTHSSTRPVRFHWQVRPTRWSRLRFIDQEPQLTSQVLLLERGSRRLRAAVKQRIASIRSGSGE